MKVRMMFVAIVAVMIAVGLLAIINMHKNPGGEREMTMNDEKLQLSKECARLLDASIKSNVPIYIYFLLNPEIITQKIIVNILKQHLLIYLN